MNPFYYSVAARAKHRCEYCRAPEAIFNFPFEVEHVLPLVNGGTSEEINLALACRSCNIFKSDHLSFEDPSTGQLSRLYDPRVDSQNEHFEFDGMSGMVNGVTPVGRATVNCLRMNSESQMLARRQWHSLGLFP